VVTDWWCVVLASLAYGTGLTALLLVIARR